MHSNSVYAMVAAIALTAGLVLVMGGSPTTRQSDTHAIELVATSTTATATDSTVAAKTVEPSPEPTAEADINEILGAGVGQMVEETTTTTTLPAPTTTKPSATSPTTTKPKSTTTTRPTPTTTALPGEFRSDFEAEFLAHINSFRAASGLPALSRDGSLNSRARDWSKRMADNGKLSHSNIANLLPPWSAAGENVGRGGSVTSLFDALVNSPGHRANILGDYTHIGIGVWAAGNGNLWTTHVFTR